MSTNVTVLGVAGGVVSVPFSSAVNAAVAQTAANVVSALVTAGSLTQFNLTGSSVPTGGSPFAGAVVTTAGGLGSTPISLPAQYQSVVVSSAGTTVLKGGVNANATVISGGGGNFTYFNNGFNTQFYFGTGSSSIIEGSGDPPSAVVNIDGFGFVGAAVGATTVNATGSSAVVNIQGGGQDIVNATSGGETIFVSGSSTVPVNINDTGSTGFTANVQGGSALINPGSGNVTVFTGASGSASVYGSSSLTGGTGALSVYGGSGYFVGGSGGGNLLETSTISGASTLVGSSGTDTMYGFSGGDIMKSTSGKDLIVAFSGGDTLVAGTGTDTMFGSSVGGNTFVYNGAGTSSSFGAYGSASATSNLYVDSVGGGKITINDFRSGKDVFDIKDGATVTSNVLHPATATSIAYSSVTLSDGTNITFNYTSVSSSDFKNG